MAADHAYLFFAISIMAVMDMLNTNSLQIQLMHTCRINNIIEMWGLNLLTDIIVQITEDV